MTLSRRAQLILSVLSLLVALAAGLLLAVRARAAVATVRRPVPRAPIAPGEILRADQFAWAEFPAAAAAGTVADPRVLEGKMARTLLRPGAPIAPAMVGEPDPGLPAGWGEVAVRLPPEAALAGALRPGERIHLLVVSRQGETTWLGPAVVLATSGREGEVLLRLGAPGAILRPMAEAVVRARMGEVLIHLARLPEEEVPP